MSRNISSAVLSAMPTVTIARYHFQISRVYVVIHCYNSEEEEEQENMD
jgi:hypothetical protein